MATFGDLREVIRTGSRIDVIYTLADVKDTDPAGCIKYVLDHLGVLPVVWRIGKHRCHNITTLYSIFVDHGEATATIRVGDYQFNLKSFQAPYAPMALSSLFLRERAAELLWQYSYEDGVEADAFIQRIKLFDGNMPSLISEIAKQRVKTESMRTNLTHLGLRAIVFSSLSVPSVTHLGYLGLDSIEVSDIMTNKLMEGLDERIWRY